MNEDNKNEVENIANESGVNTEKIETNINNKKKKNKSTLILIMIICLLIISFGLYICYDKGIIFNKNTNSSTNKSSNNNNTDKNKTDDNDNKNKDDDDKKESDKKDDSNDETISVKDNANCKSTQDQYGYPMKCTIGKYSFELKSIGYDEEKAEEYIGIYNDKNVKILEKIEYPDGGEFVSYNSDGSIIKREKCAPTKDNSEIYDCEYSTYSYDGQKISNIKNIPRIIVNYDNYVVFAEKDHIKLADFKGNVIKGFDFDVEGNKYLFHSLISGWYTDQGKKGIYLVIEDTTKEYGTSGAGLEYYYEPSTGEVGTIKTEGVGGYAKPVLYLYPKKDKTKVTVSFKDSTKLTTTYPKFKNKWVVVANKNGDLHDKDGKYYYGLYWEEDGSTKVDFTKGYYVTKDNAISFLEDKLKVIGLNDRERNEFIMYWLPILEKNKKSIVYFEQTKERQSFNKLNIEPKPDSLLRIAIHVKKVDKKPKNLTAQKLDHFERKGFTAVEWGGVNHK